MKKRILLVTVLVLAFCLIASGCSTSMMTNAKEYYSNTTAILAQLTSGSKGSEKQASAAATPLDAPGSFSVDEAGNYSFEGVANADYYLIYFCAPDAAEDDENFLYSSEPIPAHQDSNSYAGVCRDVIKAPYGEYQVRVLAVPALSDSSHSMSQAVSTAYTQVGAQSAPALEYLWDPFVNTLTLQLANADAYAYEAYPKQIDITVTNINNADDQVSLTLEGIADGNKEVSTDALTKGETYRISSTAVSDVPYVTNQTSDTSVIAEGLSIGELNILSDGYSYKHGWFTYPLLWENFDLTNGGSSVELADMQEYTLDCVPADPTPGSAYSYSYSARPSAIVTGMLELHEDGTVLCYNKNSPPIPDAEISGIWVDNGDGTATICFSNSTWHTTSTTK